MLDALCEYLHEKPGLYLLEIIQFLLDEFNIQITASSIGRALIYKNWTKKKISRIAMERNADLRDFYLYRILGIYSCQLVFVDEFG